MSNFKISTYATMNTPHKRETKRALERREISIDASQTLYTPGARGVELRIRDEDGKRCDIRMELAEAEHLHKRLGQVIAAARDTMERKAAAAAAAAGPNSTKVQDDKHTDEVMAYLEADQRAAVCPTVGGLLKLIGDMPRGSR